MLCGNLQGVVNRIARKCQGEQAFVSETAIIYIRASSAGERVSRCNGRKIKPPIHGLRRFEVQVARKYFVAADGTDIANRNGIAPADLLVKSDTVAIHRGALDFALKEADLPCEVGCHGVA